MKLIHTLIVALLLCGIATASAWYSGGEDTDNRLRSSIDYGKTLSMEDMQPYTISVIVWDTNGNRDVNTAVTFAYMGQTDTLYTADDGSVSFSLLNFDDVPDGAYINVSSKHGVKSVQVDYLGGERGVTFNEPSSAAAIAAFAAMGFVAVVAFGKKGVYWLRRKIKGDK